MRAQGGGTFRESDIKGDGGGPVVGLKGGQNNKEDTRLDIPYRDSSRYSDIVDPFTVGRGRGVGMIRP